MIRSLWKPIYQDYALFRKLKNNQIQIKIWSRASTITKNYLNKKVYVYNGKFFISLYIKKEMVGYKFGEFVYTKKGGYSIHKKKKKNKKNK